MKTLKQYSLHFEREHRGVRAQLVHELQLRGVGGVTQSEVSTSGCGYLGMGRGVMDPKIGMG